jgi:hypothetical protein
MCVVLIIEMILLFLIDFEGALKLSSLPRSVITVVGYFEFPAPAMAAGVTDACGRSVTWLLCGKSMSGGRKERRKTR